MTGELDWAGPERRLADGKRRVAVRRQRARRGHGLPGQRDDRDHADLRLEAPRPGRITVLENRGLPEPSSLVDITELASGNVGYLINSMAAYGIAIGDIDGDLDVDVVVGIDGFAWAPWAPVQAAGGRAAGGFGVWGVARD